MLKYSLCPVNVLRKHTGRMLSNYFIHSFHDSKSESCFQTSQMKLKHESSSKSDGAVSPDLAWGGFIMNWGFNSAGQGRPRGAGGGGGPLRSHAADRLSDGCRPPSQTRCLGRHLRVISHQKVSFMTMTKFSLHAQRCAARLHLSNWPFGGCYRTEEVGGRCLTEPQTSWPHRGSRRRTVPEPSSGKLFFIFFL